MSTWMNLNFQNSCSPLMEQLLFFHDHVMFILIIIMSVISYMMLNLFMNKFSDRYLLDGHIIEIVWTIIPAFILLFVAFPSLYLLYLLDEVDDSFISLKVVGHQWYWSYEYSDFLNLSFDSYMIPNLEMSDLSFRLLDVDNRVVLPYNVQIRVIISAADVIHSWTVPSMGLKVDAVPGRLNQLSLIMNRAGLFFGQCSEICGAQHSFMPIVIESVKINDYLGWVNKNF